MAKKKEMIAKEATEMKTVMVKPDNLVFYVPNPRFAGIGYGPYDPEPYGDALIKMKESMIETYKSHGVLLMQPIVATEESGMYSVRAGYTRALTFKTFYNELCKECGTADLTIAVSVMEDVNIVDAIMENVTRTEQHYVTIANAICQAGEAGKKINNIASQIGISIERALKLKRIGSMSIELKKLCFEGRIMEAAAAQISEYPSQIQNAICGAIIEDELFVEDKEDVERMYNRQYPVIPEWVPRDSFVDMEGEEHPEISKESWYINIGEMFGGARTKDIDAMNARSHKYWEMFVKENGIKLVDRYSVSYNWIKCTPGTHPEEVAYWTNDETHVEFSVNPDFIHRSSATEEALTKREEDIMRRVDSKISKLKSEAQKDIVQRECIAAYGQTGLIGYTLKYFFRYMHINNQQKEIMEKMLGIEFNTALDLFESENMADDEYYSSIMQAYLLANMATSHFATEDIKNALKNAGKNIEKNLDLIYATIDAQREEMIAKASDKVDEMKEDASNRIAFVKGLFSDIYFDSCDSLYRTIKFSDDVENEPLLKFIARNLDLKYVGTYRMMKSRVLNTVDYIVKKHEIIANDNVPKNAVYVEKMKEFVFNYFKYLTLEEQSLNGVSINDMIKQLSVKMHELGVIEFTGSNNKSYDVKNIIKADAERHGYRYDENNKLIMESIKSFIAVHSNTMSFSVYYKNEKNKILLF